MTEGQRRAAPLQDALNDLNRVKRDLQRALTTPGAVDDEAAGPALAFLDKIAEAEREGLTAVRRLQGGGIGR